MHSSKAPHWRGLIVLAAITLLSPQAVAQTTTELTAEQYRDLIVQTADPMSDMATYGDVGGSGASDAQVLGGEGCVGSFTRTDAKTRNAAELRQVWSRARVPAALRSSHAEILAWMQSGEPLAARMPACMRSAFQAEAGQFAFLMHLGDYNDLRTNAATALGGMGVTLPPNSHDR